MKVEGVAPTITESFGLKNVPRNTWSSTIESALLHIHVSTAAQNRQKAQSVCSNLHPHCSMPLNPTRFFFQRPHDLYMNATVEKTYFHKLIINNLCQIKYIWGGSGFVLTCVTRVAWVWGSVYSSSKLVQTGKVVSKTCLLLSEWIIPSSVRRLWSVLFRFLVYSHTDVHTHANTLTSTHAV